MKLLFDQNLSFRLCKRLSDVFPHSVQVQELGLANADDRVLWEHAKREGFAIVSQDADFAEMAALLGPPPKVIWLRGGNRRTEAIEAALRREAAAVTSFGDVAGMACLEIY